MTAQPRHPSDTPPPAGSAGLLLFSWLFVGLPLAWGVYSTIVKSLALFH